MSSDLRLRLACIAIGYIISVLVLVIAHIPETTLAPPVTPVVAPPVAPPVAPLVAPLVAPPRLRGGESEMAMGDIIRLLSGFVHTTHRLFLSLPRATERDIWAAYASEVERTLVPFDRRFRGRTLFPVRDDDSMFVSIASYRDGQLATTLRGAYSRARAPERLHVGVVMQNCAANCRTGVQDLCPGASCTPKTAVRDAPPDADGYVEPRSSPFDRARENDA